MLRVRGEDAVVAPRVAPRRRDERGDAREQLVGGADEEERPAPRPLHPVDEPTVGPLRQTVERERRPHGVAAEPLEPLAVVLVDADPGVEREAVEMGRSASVLERIREAEPPVHLGGLEGGEGVLLVTRPALLVARGYGE